MPKEDKLRSYQHKPDAVWIQRRFDSKRRGIDTVTATVEKSGRAGGRLIVFDTAVDTVLDAVRLGWALEQPIETLRTWIIQASEWAGEAVDRGRTLDGGLAEKWLAVALLAGSFSVADRVSRRVPDHVEGLHQRDPVARGFLLSLSRLTTGDAVGAAAAAAAATKAATTASASPEAIEAYEGLAEVASAVATSDQPAFDHAVGRRVEALVRRFNRSVEGRRHPDGLLDLRTASLAVVAHRAGLGLPRDNPYIGTDLIEAAG